MNSFVFAKNKNYLDIIHKFTNRNASTFKSEYNVSIIHVFTFFPRKKLKEISQNQNERTIYTESPFTQTYLASFQQRNRERAHC